MMKILFIFLATLTCLLLAPFVSGDLITSLNDENTYILMNLRLPRILTALLAGGGLAVSGAVFQSLFRNSLATPYTLGVASGASLGAVIAISSGFVGGFWIFDGIGLLSYAGATIAIFSVYFFARLKGRMQTSFMLLAGVAIGLTFSSLILFVQYLNNDINSARIVRWLMGGIEVVGFETPLKILLPVLFGSILIFKFSRHLNLISVGDNFAISRGIDIKKMRVFYYFVVSFILAAIVSECGPIGFVGLMIPHIGRTIIGNDNSRLIPGSFLLGGIFLILCDIVSRNLLDIHIPIGVVTALLGGPFFLILLFRARKF